MNPRNDKTPRADHKPERIAGAHIAFLVTLTVLTGSARVASSTGTASSTVDPAASGAGGFSAATAACIKQAVTNLQTCPSTMTATECKAVYQTAYANCFAAGTGVACATSCWAARATCEDPAQTAGKVCSATCVSARAAALKLCQPTDTICASAAQANYTACKRACAQQVAPPLEQCALAFDSCIGRCPDLPVTGCGNGILDPGEQCDDGNTANGDCCSASCQLEPAGSPCSDDGNVCTDDQCDANGVCDHVNNAEPCDDGNFCTVGDVCQQGVCQGVPRDCSASADQCNDGACDAATGECVARPRADGTPCDDGNVCTENEACQQGSCLGGNQLSCDDGDACTVDTCDPLVGCASRQLEGLAGVTCLCTGDLEPLKCQGQKVPSRVRGRVTRACSLIQRAGTKTSRARMAKAARALTAAANVASQAGKRGSISAQCAAALSSTLADADVRAQRLAEIR